MENLPIRSLDKALKKFEIEILKSVKAGEGIHVEAHRHDYYHILYVKKGFGEHWIDFKKYEIIPNSIFFVSPGQVHSLKIDEHIEAYVITFNSHFYLLNDSIQKLMDYPFFHSINNEPVIYLPESMANIQFVLDELYKEDRSTEKGKNTILRAFLEVILVRISRLYKQHEINNAPSHLSFQLRNLEALIDTHFRDLKLLNDYADLMHISPKHLNGLCKRGLNKTVTNLIHERTLIEVKRLLLFTDQSISEIAFELGFADKSYFMRFFKKHTSLTADAFRKQNINT